jgi:syntaxin 5
MTVQNRTKEFYGAIDSLQSRGSGAMHASQLMNRLGSSTNSSGDRKPLLGTSGDPSGTAAGMGRPSTPLRSEYSRRAAHVGKSIALTHSKLDKLERLAKKKSLFDDRPVEIQEMTLVLKEDIGRLNVDIQHMQQQLNSSSSSNSSGEQMNRQWREHSSNIIVALQSKLAQTSGRFKDILEIRTQNLKEQQERKDKFASSSSKQSSSSSSSVLLPNSHTPLSHSSSNPMYAPEKKSTQVAIDMPLIPQQEQQQLQMVHQQNDQYLHGRVEAIEGVERTINELASLFTQLTTMINAHDDLITRYPFFSLLTLIIIHMF